MSETVRKAVVSCSVILTLIGMGLSIGAILTPSWQVVNLREYNSIHEHGLWLDCTRHTRDGSVLLRRYSTITEPLHCVYKFDYDKYSGTFDLEDDNSPVGEVNRHKFYGWHTATLVLLGLALITSFASVCLGACGCCYASVSLVFTAATLITTFLSSIAEGLFFFFSHRADNRFIKGIVGTYEQRVGVAFFLQMGACFFHFFAFLVAMLATYFAFTGKDIELERDQFSMPTSSKTNITNVGRNGGFLRRQQATNDSASIPLLLQQKHEPSLHSSRPNLFTATGASGSGWLSSPVAQRGYADEGSTTIGGAESLSQLNGGEIWQCGDAKPTSFTVGSQTPGSTLNRPALSQIGGVVAKRQEIRYMQESMEFEHPVFVQQPTRSPTRPPFYRSQQDDFDRVADSMPELGHGRSYQPDLMPMPTRVRRKSETCV